MELIKQNTQLKIIKTLLVVLLGSLILAEIVKIIDPKKITNNDLIIFDLVFCFISSIKNITLILIDNLY